MADLKVRIFKGDDPVPDTTVTIPGGVLRIASKLIPKKAMEVLLDQGIDFEEIIELSENPEAHGHLLEVEEHKKNQRIIISLE